MELKESSIKKAKQILQWVTWRDLLDSVALFLVFFFIIRTLTAEAFVIPTGSMAPSLMGQHAILRSPYNGYEFQVGRNLDRDAEGNIVYSPQIAIDPMTNREFAIEANNYQSGDRILVLKYMAPFHTPKRWDVCVFKAPQAPEHNYIKRLIGMPGEELKIAQGNIYTRPLDSTDDVPWSIQRKPLRIQKHLWFPIYHSQYHSINELFWKQNPNAAEFNHEPFQSPWQAHNPSNWEIQDGRVFTYKGKEATSPGRIEFVFKNRGNLSGIDYYAYNPRRSLRGEKTPNEIVEDLRVSSVITPSSARTLYRKSIKVTDATLRVELEGSQATLTIHDSSGNLLVENKASFDAFTAGKPTKVELWHADQSLRLMINEVQVGDLLTYEVPMATRIARYSDSHVDFTGTKQIITGSQLHGVRQPEVSIEIEGRSATITNLNLDRDQHYAQTEPDNDKFFAYQMRGDQRPQAVGIAKNAARIPEGYYFALGDNSANSNDSRRWGLAHPMVRQWHYALTQEDIEIGTIPARMMIGRGIMVYFPATIGPRIPSASPVLSDWGIVPDLKKTRLIH